MDSYVQIRDQRSEHYGRKLRVRARLLTTEAVQVEVSDTVLAWFEDSQYTWVV